MLPVTMLASEWNCMEALLTACGLCPTLDVSKSPSLEGAAQKMLMVQT